MAIPPPTLNEAATAQAPSRFSRMEIASVVVFIFAFLFGIGSFASTVAAWNDDDYYNYYYYDDEELSAATISAIFLGAICLILGIVAIPLAFVAARTYLRARNALESSHGTCLAGWYIAAWIIYGITIINGLSAVIVGASGGDVPPGLVAAIVIFMSIAWGLMITYTELARRRQTSQEAVAAFAAVMKFSKTGTSTSSPPDPNAMGESVTALSQSDKDYMYGPTQSTGASLIHSSAGGLSSAVSDSMRFQQDPTGGDAMARSPGSASARQNPAPRTPPVAFVQPSGFKPSLKDQCRTILGETPMAVAVPIDVENPLQNRPANDKKRPAVDP